MKNNMAFIYDLATGNGLRIVGATEETVASKIEEGEGAIMTTRDSGVRDDTHMVVDGEIIQRSP